MSNEIKVGLLLIAALGVLGWLAVASGTLGLGRSVPMRELSSVFEDVEGIKEGSPVKMAGVDIGNVTRVDLQPNGTAVLRYKVRQSVALPADVSAQITASGLIGERYVALVPGISGRLGDGGLLATDIKQLPVKGNVDPANISTDFAKMADDMKGMTGNLKNVLGDPETGRKLQEIIDGLAKFSNGLGGDNGAVVQDLGRAAKNFADMSESIKNGQGVLGQLAAKNSQTSRQLDDTMVQMNAAIRDLRQVVEKINNGQGTLGHLVNDPGTGQKLDTALDTFNGLTGGISSRFLGGKSTSGSTVSGSSVGDGAANDGGAPSRLRAEATLEAVNILGEDDIYKGSANARLQAGTKFVDLGVAGDGFASNARSQDNVGGPYYGKDFGSEAKYTAQVGQTFGERGNMALRAGLKNSTAGVGADLYSTVPFTDKRVRYSADVYDFGGNNTPGDDAHVDVTARADLIGTRVYGIVGYDNVLSSEYGGPMVGLGLKFQTSDPVAPKKDVAGKAL